MNDGLFKIRGLILTISLISSLWVSANCIKKEFIMGWDEHSEPLMYYDVDEGVTGLDIKFVKEVFRQAKCQLTFKSRPWNRVLYEIKQGSVDLTAASSWVKERSQYAYYSEEYRWEQMRIAVRKGEVRRWPLNHLSDIASLDMRLTGLLGAWYGTEFAALNNNP
ncbi:substrate-binding periplasmic protein, partial [Zooshikella harenae]